MLFDHLRQTATRWPDRLAIVDLHQQVTFGQLCQSADRLSGLLRGLVGPSSTPIGILLPSSAGFATAFYAIQSAGRAALPLNFMLAPVELAAVLADSTAALVLTSRQMQAHVDAVRAAPGCPSNVKFFALEDCTTGTVPLVPGPQQGGQSPFPKKDSEMGTVPSVLLYTSGSTGQPKGVLLSAGNLLADSLGCIELARMEPGKPFLGPLPLFHTFGLTGTLIVPMLLGSTVYYLPRFAPRQALDMVRSARIAVMMAIPSMYAAMVRVALSDPAQADLADCNLVIAGGEPLSPLLARQFEKTFSRPLLEGYGLTESSPVVALNLPWAHRRGTVGLPLPNLRVEIVDENLAAVPRGSLGEIAVIGPTVMLGYFRRGAIEPVETATVKTPAGGLRTGDMGLLDADGFLTIAGRIKDIIIVGGENVFPAEVEQVLISHPKVGRAAVIGLPDGLRGEMVAAFVTPVDPADPLDVAELRSFCRERLAGYKVPRRIEILTELPLTPTGKVNKRALRDTSAARRPTEE